MTNDYALSGTNKAAIEGPKRCRPARDKRTLLPGTNEAAAGYLKGADTIIGVEGLKNTGGHVRNN